MLEMLFPCHTMKHVYEMVSSQFNPSYSGYKSLFLFGQYNMLVTNSNLLKHDQFIVSRCYHFI